MRVSFVKSVVNALIIFLLAGALERARAQEEAGRVRRPLEKVRLHVPAKSLTFIPYYFGQSKGIFEKEGVVPEIIVMRPPIGVTALQAGEIDYSASSGLSIRAAMKGLPLRTIFFSQTQLSFSLIGQPGMSPAKIRNVAVSGVGSLAHYAALAMMKKLGNEKVAYIMTNTTASSYAVLTSKAADAAILSPPYTSMAALAGYHELGNTFDVRDLQGGLVVRATHIQTHREQVKRMIRGILRSLDVIFKREEEVIQYLQAYFGLEPKVAVESYKILNQVLSVDGDIEEPVLKSIVEKIRQESSITTEVRLERLVDLSILREVRAELGRK